MNLKSVALFLIGGTALLCLCSAIGFAVFEIPAAAESLTLHFDPFALDEQGEPLRLEVPIP